MQLADAIRKAIPAARLRLQSPGEVDVSMRQQELVSDPALARDILGFAPEFGIDAAVADMVQWLRDRPSRT